MSFRCSKSFLIWGSGCTQNSPVLGVSENTLGHEKAGYRVRNLPAAFRPKLNEQRKSKIKMFKPKYRLAASVKSLGCEYFGFSAPYPDVNDANNWLLGWKHRINCKFTGATSRYKFYLRSEARRLAKQMTDEFGFVSVDDDFSLKRWIDSRKHYSLKRKEQIVTSLAKAMNLWSESFVWTEFDPPLLQRLLWWESLDDDRRSEILNCKSFLKKEYYMSYKNPRTINSRSDVFKALTGPIVESISEIAYCSPWMVKKIPVRDRPKYISEYLAGYPVYLATDHSSFEAHVTTEVYYNTEHQVYKRLLMRHPQASRLLSILDYTCEESRMVSKFGRVPAACRMSGEMTTSLGNGIVNRCAAGAMARFMGWKNFRMVAEGDDGVIGCTGEIPSKEVAALFGFSLKMQSSQTLGVVGFCTMYWCDEENVVDPYEKLLTFGTTLSVCGSRTSVLLGLLRSKALSLVYELPGCPILRNLGLYGLRVTRGVQSVWKEDFWWRQEVFQGDLGVNDLSDEIQRRASLLIPYERRLLFERLSGIAPEDQVQIEKYLDGLNDLQSIRHPILDVHLMQRHLHCAHFSFVN